MSSSNWFYTMSLGWFKIHIEGLQGIISKFQDALQSLKIILGNSADPEEMLHYASFHLEFTVCQSTHLGKVLRPSILIVL